MEHDMTHTTAYPRTDMDTLENSLTLRLARPADADAVAELSALDSATTPAQPVLIAEIEGEIQAAISLSDDTVVADPFRPTVALVAILQARAQQLRRPAGGTRRRRRFELVPRRVDVLA